MLKRLGALVFVSLLNNSISTSIIPEQRELRHTTYEELREQISDKYAQKIVEKLDELLGRKIVQGVEYLNQMLDNENPDSAIAQISCGAASTAMLLDAIGYFDGAKDDLTLADRIYKDSPDPNYSIPQSMKHCDTANFRGMSESVGGLFSTTGFEEGCNASHRKNILQYIDYALKQNGSHYDARLSNEPSFDESYDLIRRLVDNGFPALMSVAVPVQIDGKIREAWHIVLVKGYKTDEQSVVVNDPWTDLNIRLEPQASRSGENAVYALENGKLKQVNWIISLVRRSE